MMRQEENVKLFLRHSCARICALLLAACMMIVVFPFISEAKTIVTLNESTTTLSDGAVYEVFSDVTNNNRLTVEGEAVLVLGPGTTLNLTKGIELSGSDKKLTIRGSGALIAQGGENQAGIGGYQCGHLIIENGSITATGGIYGAGIGGSLHSTGMQTITIKGGNVTARGGMNAAGIGGGCNTNWAGHYGNCGDVTITGGTVTATGNGAAAGIGGGAAFMSGAGAGNAGTITITGGTVTANGGSRGYGIGPGINIYDVGGNGLPGNIVLGFSSCKSSVTADSYCGTAVTVAEGRMLADDDNDYTGTLTDTQIDAIAGSKLSAIPEFGDTDKNGSVNISDATALLNTLAGNVPNSRADLNNDGQTNISDVTALLDYLSTLPDEELTLPGLGGGGTGPGSTNVAGRIKTPSEQDIWVDENSPRSASDVCTLVRQKTPALRTNYATFLKRYPAFQGTIIMQFTIAPGGELLYITILSSDIDVPGFGEAIISSMQQWKFARVQKGNATVIVPFEFYIDE